MDEIDIYRSAKLLIDQYGADAAVQAGKKAAAMKMRGDMQRWVIWKRIGQAIADIQVVKGRTEH
jgi:hypothetical protein